jgi:hypothetical protein
MLSVSFNAFAFSSSLTYGRDLSQFWVVDSAYSINFTAFRNDSVSFNPPSGTSRVGGVGVDIRGSNKVKIAIPIVYGMFTYRIVHALYTPSLSSRSVQHIGRKLNVNDMQSNSGCEIIFPTDPNVVMLLVPTRLGLLQPSGNGLYFLRHTPRAGEAAFQRHECCVSQ